MAVVVVVVVVVFLPVPDGAAQLIRVTFEW